MSAPAKFYVRWFSNGDCEIGCDPANTIEEARTIISHWVPNLEPGDRIEIEETN